MKKIRVAVLYGGKSGEHEVSLQSAASVIQHLDRSRFEVVPVSIDKSGRWQWNDLALIEASKGKALPIFQNSPELRLQSQADGKTLLQPLSGGQGKAVDVFFPVMHGPLCEDGTVQGMLELADVAYVGSGVLGSAIGMDKDVAKRLAKAAGVPVAPYLCVKRETYDANKAAALLEAKKLRLPVFVKPVNMGSSVGVHKVKKWEDLETALQDAFQYDRKVLIEQGVNAREIELAVLDGDPLFVSTPSEIRALGKHEFYSYEAKYLDESGSSYDLPAKLSAGETKRAQEIALSAFTALECEGMARVDLFLDRDSGEFFFNEVNTIPGFTSISMYPKMMEASGVPYPELLTRLIELALRRHEAKQKLKRDFHK
jgi:D-alanine-D-alanine ligase